MGKEETPAFFNDGATGTKLNQWLKFLLRRIPRIGAGLGKLSSGDGDTWFTEEATVAAADEHPWKLRKDSNEDGEPILRISRASSLQLNIGPDSEIEIDGIEDDIPIPAGGDFFCVWLEIDVSGQYQDPKVDISAAVGYGEKWGDDKDFWPAPIQYNTDDGKADPEDPDALPTKVYYLLGYIDSSEYAQDRGMKIGEDQWLVQLARINAVMSDACYESNGRAPSVYPPSGTIPPSAY